MLLVCISIYPIYICDCENLQLPTLKWLFVINYSIFKIFIYVFNLFM